MTNELEEVNAVIVVNEISTADLIQFKLQENKAVELKQTFDPMMKLIGESEAAFNDIVSRFDPESKDLDPGLMAEAKRLRLDIAKIRTETDRMRKSEKDESIRYGKAVDGIANIVIYAVKSKEEKLKLIEKHAENIELEKKLMLKAERIELLAPYGFDKDVDLGIMEDYIFDTLLKSTKQDFEDLQEARQRREDEEKAEKVRAQLHLDRKTEMVEFKSFIEDFEKVDFGSMNSDEYFETTEKVKKARFNHNEESKRLDAINKLHSSRKDNLTVFAPFINDFNDLAFGVMTEDEYMKVLAEGSQAKMDYDEAQEKIESDNKRLKQEAIDREEAIAKDNADRLLKEKAAADELEAAEIAAQKIRDDEKAESDRIAKEELEAKEKTDAEAKRVRDSRMKELQPYIVFIRDLNFMLELCEEEYIKELAEVKEGAKQQAEFEAKKKREEAEKIAADAEEKRVADVKLLAESSKEITPEAIQKVIDSGDCIFVKILRVDKDTGKSGIFISNE